MTCCHCWQNMVPPTMCGQPYYSHYFLLLTETFYPTHLTFSAFLFFLTQFVPMAYSVLLPSSLHGRRGGGQTVGWWQTLPCGQLFPFPVSHYTFPSASTCLLLLFCHACVCVLCVCQFMVVCSCHHHTTFPAFSQPPIPTHLSLLSHSIL